MNDSIASLTRRSAMIGTLLSAAGVVPALAAVDVDPKLPAYKPDGVVTGDVVCGGNHATDDVILKWAKKFAEVQPGVSVRLRNDTRLTTDAYDVAIAAGDIDLIPSAREPVPSETERLTKKLGGPPLVVAVATGSYATKSATHALAFYVNAANPLERITVEQIREIYSPGGKITKWGHLGLTGDWADLPIHVFTVPISDPNGNPLGIINYLQKRVFGGQTGWRRSIYQVDSTGPALQQHMLNNIVRLVAGDRQAIGFSGFAFGMPGAKTLEVAETAAGPYYKGTHDEVANRTYAFTRTIYLGVNQPVGAQLRAPVREFLRFILSRDGQQVFADGEERYLPLTADVAASERAKVH